MYHPFETSYIAKGYASNQRSAHGEFGYMGARSQVAVHHLSGEHQETSDSRFPLIPPALSRIKMWPRLTPRRSSTSTIRDLHHLPIFSTLRSAPYLHPCSSIETSIQAARPDPEGANPRRHDHLMSASPNPALHSATIPAFTRAEKR